MPIPDNLPGSWPLVLVAGARNRWRARGRCLPTARLAIRAPNVLQTAAAPNDHYGALFIDAKQIESTVQIGGHSRVSQEQQ